MGIGNTTPAAALIAAALGLPASEVTGRGTGIDEAALAHKEALIDQALARAGDRTADPVECLTALGSADLAAATGYLVAAAEAGVPVLLDGVISVACALTADRIAPGAAAWFAAGHRSTEPAQSLALDKLGLEPVLDLGHAPGRGQRRGRRRTRAAQCRQPCCATLRCSPTCCRMRDAWRLAVGTLTAVPVRAPAAVDAAHGRPGDAAGAVRRGAARRARRADRLGRAASRAEPARGRLVAVGALAAGQPRDPLGRAVRHRRRADRLLRRRAVAGRDEVRHLRPGWCHRDGGRRRGPGSVAGLAVRQLAGSRAGGRARLRSRGSR